MKIRRSGERGQFDFGWLDTRHTFSFGQYHDPEYMGYRSLRVINEDRIAPGTGFPSHPHREMEIITIVLSGSIEHTDSLGSSGVLEPGEIQVMSAGRGIVHSEANPSVTESLHLYQIWITPGEHGVESRYQQRPFSAEERQGRWQTVVSPDGRDNSIFIHQDAHLLLCDLDSDQTVLHLIEPGRGAWLQVMEGEVEIADENLYPGDGVAIDEPGELSVSAAKNSRLMLFDLA